MNSKLFYQNNGFLAVKNNDEKFYNLCLQAGKISYEFATGKRKAKQKWKAKDGNIKQSVDVHRHSDLFRDIIYSQPVRKIISNVFGNNPTFVNHSKISFKFNNQQKWFPHQDVAYKKDKKNMGITICVHLDNIKKENGALVCFNQSHKNGFVEHDVVFSEIESDPQICANNYEQYEKTIIEGNIGDILYFDFNTIHSSEGNQSNGCRPIFIFEVEAIKGIPLEADGKKAITFNYNYPNFFVILPKRIINYFRNQIIFPVLKKILNMMNKFGLLYKLKIKS